MGIIYNENVEESKIHQAYGLSAYGKINHYEWTFRNETENALITFRIADESGNDIFSIHMGNRFIFQCRIDDTLDNFLWWIAEDKPDSYTIEQQVFKTLCASDSFFNYKIQERKRKQKRKEEEKKRILECEAMENSNKENIKSYCSEKDLFSYFTYDRAFIIKPHNDKAKSLLESADNKKMEALINFIKQYPQNEDAHIVKDGIMEEILHYIE